MKLEKPSSKVLFWLRIVLLPMRRDPWDFSKLTRTRILGGSMGGRGEGGVEVVEEDGG